eukprot:7501700-Pyramimonas_sp.AAC.2
MDEFACDLRLTCPRGSKKNVILFRLRVKLNSTTLCTQDVRSGGYGLGRVVLELKADVCPTTCDNFRQLCEYKCYTEWRLSVSHSQNLHPNTLSRTRRINVASVARNGHSGAHKLQNTAVNMKHELKVKKVKGCYCNNIY